MKCPFCEENETKVLDSRILKEGFCVRRRRKCESCERRFTTYENIEIQMPCVVKLDGRREPYNREKLISGFEKACQKRAISTEVLEKSIDELEKNILEISDKEIRSSEIGNLVMKSLRKLDPVAYIRFASVYRKFQDVDEFVNDIKSHEHDFSKNQAQHPNTSLRQ